LLAALAALARWTLENPVLFVVLVAVVYILYVLFASTHSVPTIQLVSAWDGDSVDFQQAIYGLTKDANMPVELRVYAGDKWHRQRPIKRNGNKWRSKCQFGDSANPSSGAVYKLVAISPKPKQKLEDKITELPHDVIRSEIISVVRSNRPT
jgi:hypothetical protein